MQFKHFLPLALFGAALLGACTDTPTAAPTPGPGVGEPTPKSLGLVEIRLSGVGTSRMTASVLPVRANLSPVPAGTIQLDRLSATTVDVGTRGNGGQRYIQAVFRVRNAGADGKGYPTPRQNLTLIPVSSAGTLAGTPVREFLRQDGTPADASFARALMPTGAVALNGAGSLVSQYPDVMQAFTETEVGALDLPQQATNRFPYGFVVRGTGNMGTRVLPADPALDQFDGRVTVAYRIPLAASPAQDPFTISILAAAVDDDETRVTQAPEEQTADGRAAFEARAALLVASKVTVFPGGGYTGNAAKRVLCDVRTAGTEASPDTVLVPCPAIASVVVGPQPAFAFVGGTHALAATVTDVNGAPAEWAAVSWSSSDPTVATVSATGQVSFVGAGSATITATSRGKTGSVSVQVSATTASTFSAGYYHSCALTPAGKAYCWGVNEWGTLGDGTRTYSSQPVAVLGDLTFVRISAGRNYTLALTADGTAYAWGAGSLGQLGDGAMQDRTTPVQVAGGHRFAQLAAGREHSVALSADGTAFAWGQNARGQLGDGTNVMRATPVAVQGGLTFASLAAGDDHTCGLSTAGLAYCWGGGDVGQLGNGKDVSLQGYELPLMGETDQESWTPTPVVGGHVFRSISAGTRFTVALTLAGEAYAWGYNAEGQLGDSTYTTRSVPAPVAGGHRFVSLTAGGLMSVAFQGDGTVFTWGDNRNGQLGDGTVQGRNVPGVLPMGGSFVAVAPGEDHMMGITAGGALFAWGYNLDGRVGDGTFTSRTSPTAVIGEIVFQQP
jgi:alpha-tubulin suppressor-like RCC1 family protein